MTSLTVTRCGDKTTNDNYILTLEGAETIVTTPFGDKKHKPSYCMAVLAPKEVGFVADLDMSLFTVTTRRWVDDEGKEVINNWLHLK